MSFLWHVPQSWIYLLAGILSLFMINQVHYDLKQGKVIAVWGILQFYMILNNLEFGFFLGNLNKLIFFFVISIIIGLPIQLKYRLFDNLSNLLACLLSVSIVGWCLYLMGINIPAGELYISDDNFHVLRNYYFFVRSERVVEQAISFIPRFCSVFQEPGQLAVPCAFMFFAGRANMKDIRNWVYLAAIILSFSLSGFSLLFIGGVSLYLVPKFKQSIKAKLLVIAICVIGFTSFVSLQETEDSDNPFYSLIVARLAFDEEKGIVGNNRTHTYFDARYDELMQTSNVWMGLNNVEPNLLDWASNTSGYKKYILYFGLIGLFLTSWFIYLMFRYNSTYESFSYVMIVVLAFLPRNLIMTPTWLIPVVLGIFLLGHKSSVLVSNSYK